MPQKEIDMRNTRRALAMIAAAFAVLIAFIVTGRL
jgi:hypothetical protein